MYTQEKDKILIIDEDSNYISGLRKSLNQAGYDVLSFDDPTKALEIVNDIQPQMIIADIELSETPEHSFFKEVKNSPVLKNVPFIALSSQKRVDDRIRSIEMGIDDFISKPFYIEEVVSRVERIFKELQELQEYQQFSSHGFGGNLSDKNVIDLIQLLEKENKTAIIHLSQGKFSGNLYINSGQVHDAVFKDYKPSEALSKLLVWTEGRYFVEYDEFNRPRTLTHSNQAIIDLGLQRIKQWNQIKYHLPPLMTELYKAELAATKNNISDDERTLISSLNGSKVIYEMVLHSPFDDVKALELIYHLYEKGYLKESDVTFSDEKKKAITDLKSNPHMSNPTDTHSILTNFLQNETESLQEIQDDRRAANSDRRQQEERRKLNDRRHSRRIIHQKLYLNKTELIMIREKLS